MNPTIWTLTDTSPRTRAPIRVFVLENQHGHIAFFRVERLMDGRLILRVTFGDDAEPARTKLYQRAHAARFLAHCLDTMADLSAPGETPVHIDEHGQPELHGNRVELSGHDAVLLTAPFFGDDAADVLFNENA